MHRTLRKQAEAVKHGLPNLEKGRRVWRTLLEVCVTAARVVAGKRDIAAGFTKNSGTCPLEVWVRKSRSVRGDLRRRLTRQPVETFSRVQPAENAESNAFRACASRLPRTAHRRLSPGPHFPWSAKTIGKPLARPAFARSIQKRFTR